MWSSRVRRNFMHFFPLKCLTLYVWGNGRQSRVTDSPSVHWFGFQIWRKVHSHPSPKFLNLSVVSRTQSLLYEGESNENLKFVMKIRNFTPLSCKLVSMLQIACRMACRWQHSADTRTPPQYQYKDGCPTWDLHQGRTAFCYSVFA